VFVFSESFPVNLTEIKMIYKNIIQTLDEFDRDKIKFADKVFTTFSGSKLVSFRYDQSPICVQTQIVTCPFGFSLTGKEGLAVNRVPEDPSIGFKRHHNLKISFVPGTDVRRLMKNIDNFFIDNIMENSNDWFGKSFNNRTVLQEALYNSTVKQAKQYDPLMTARLKFDRFEPIFGIFDESEREIRIKNPDELVELIPKGTKLRFLLISSSLWYAAGRCGVSWDVLQLQIIETPLVIKTKKFMFKPSRYIDNQDVSTASDIVRNHKKIKL
jgi:hypothetical protein